MIDDLNDIYTPKPGGFASGPPPFRFWQDPPQRAPRGGLAQYKYIGNGTSGPPRANSAKLLRGSPGASNSGLRGGSRGRLKRHPKKHEISNIPRTPRGVQILNTLVTPSKEFGSRGILKKASFSDPNSTPFLKAPGVLPGSPCRRLPGGRDRKKHGKWQWPFRPISLILWLTECRFWHLVCWSRPRPRPGLGFRVGDQGSRLQVWVWRPVPRFLWICRHPGFVPARGRFLAQIAVSTQSIICFPAPG